jgi:hypothetical protein
MPFSYEVVYGSLGVVEKGIVDDIESIPFHEVTSESEFVSFRNTQGMFGMEFIAYREYLHDGICTPVQLMITGEGFEPHITTLPAMGIEPHPF